MVKGDLVKAGKFDEIQKMTADDRIGKENPRLIIKKRIFGG